MAPGKSDIATGLLADARPEAAVFPLDDRTAPPRPAADAPCAHCGLPVGPHPVGEGPHFCCTGCAVVYEALHEAGLDGTFYRLRGLAREPRPARRPADDLRLAELDTDAFLAEHTRPAGDGTRRTDLFLDGVHCAACVWLAERLPFEMEGIYEARLDLPRARLTLRFDPAAVRLSDAARWLARFGYAAHPARQQPVARRTAEERRLLLRLGLCWALAGNVMLLAFAFYAGLDTAADGALATAARWTSFALSGIAVAVGGSVFFRRAWASLRLAARARRLDRLHMDTPIAIGILVGFGHSAWATVSGRGEVWFDSITVLIAALLTARWLQFRSRRLAGDATERLLALLPSMARRVRPDGTAEPVRLDDVRPGDLLEVPAGEVFPVDGVVADGFSTVNNAVLTGESRPEEVGPGAAVTAGATNLRSALRVRTAAAGDATRIGRLMAWIRSDDGRRAGVVLLADRLAGYFVGGVLVLALATALAWSILDPSRMAAHVVALLVISCPCALGMATPLAMAVAAGRAARQGLFIKSDAATQQLTAVDTVVLDKTGTLTEGHLDLVAFAGDAAALDLAAALEAHSNHPIAAAFAAARPAAAALPVEAVEAAAGQGLTGRVGERLVQVGRPSWVAREAPIPPALHHTLGTYAAHGHTPVAVAVEGRVAAVLAFGDRLRADAPATLDRLRRAGCDVFLLSGDHDAVVRSVGAALDLAADRCLGEVMPEQKQAFVERLRAEGRTVAMVGDGVNDAAALRAADVGIAVEGGATPSLVAADVFMTREGLAPVAALFDGAGRVMRRIRWLLGFSLAYNLAGAAAAMLGLVTPLVAAVAMPVSSLAVVVGAALLHPFSPPPDAR